MNKCCEHHYHSDLILKDMEKNGVKKTVIEQRTVKGKLVNRMVISRDMRKGKHAIVPVFPVDSMAEANCTYLDE